MNQYQISQYIYLKMSQKNIKKSLRIFYNKKNLEVCFKKSLNQSMKVLQKIYSNLWKICKNNLRKKCKKKIKEQIYKKSIKRSIQQLIKIQIKVTENSLCLNMNFILLSVYFYDWAHYGEHTVISFWFVQCTAFMSPVCQQLWIKTLVQWIGLIR